MKEKVFKACLYVIEKEGFKAFSFAKASQESGLPLTIFYKYFQTPSDVMIALFQKIDEDVLKSFKVSEGLSTKDALFEIFMTRFDVASPYKSILKSFWEDWIFAPNEYPALMCQGFTSMSWMLESTHLNTRGMTGLLRIQGLMALYLLTVRTWLSDDTPDLGKTMAFLDNGLSNLEKAEKFLKSISPI